MKVTLRTLPITEQMYDYIFQHWRLDYPEVWDKNFIQVSGKDEWINLLADDNSWKPTYHYIYISGDSTYILSKDGIFGDCPTPDYGKLGVNYWYVWHFRASDNITVNSKIEKVINGHIAWMKFQTELKKHYTKDDIQAIIDKYGTELPEGWKPDVKHSGLFLKDTYDRDTYVPNKIYKFTDVHHYDINKAYAANIMTFFPELKDWIYEQYKVDKPYFKKVLNYAVGMMTHFNEYNKLRNTIVINTTNKVNDAEHTLNSFDSIEINTNTDGFMIDHPCCVLEHSKEIGDFDKEPVDNNTVWVTKVKVDGYNTYSIMQWYEDGEKVIKSIGGFLQEQKLIDKIDLSKNQVVLFKTTNTKGKRVVTEMKELNDYGK